jgi:hypothetical protein
MAHSSGVRMQVNPDEKLAEQGGAIERGHDVSQRIKIERGLAQAQDRATLIPIDRILHDFGIER